MISDIKDEIEVFGVTYERFALHHLFARLTKKLLLHEILEIPASGAKAMPSLYSLGFALAGNRVTLADADSAGLQMWSNLGLAGQVQAFTQTEIWEAHTLGQRWDLCWNFAVLPLASDPADLLRKMANLSRRWLLVINVNRFNAGFNMHRTVHKFWKIPWAHGNLRWFSPFKTCRMLRDLGYRDIHWGVVDCPPWPDSPGFRDLRLHRQAAQEMRWRSPYIEMLRMKKFPNWMKFVYLGERLPLPNILKLPYSHLYYAYCRVDHEDQG